MRHQATPADAERLAAHIEDTIEATAAFDLEHYHAATPLQRVVDRITEGLGQPAVVVVLLGLISVWLAGNSAAERWFGAALDPAPFVWLELAGTLTALVAAILILATQRRADMLSDRRDRMILELALLSDRRSAKIISLLEELRRDHPQVADRFDEESAEMAKPADPRVVLAAIDERADHAGAAAVTEQQPQVEAAQSAAASPHAGRPAARRPRKAV